MKQIEVILILFFTSYAVVSTATYQNIYLTLTSRLQVGDEIVAKGTFLKKAARISMFGEDKLPRCAECRPLTIVFRTRRHQFFAGSSNRQAGSFIEKFLFEKIIHEIKSKSQFELCIKIHSENFEVIFNKVPLFNISYEMSSFDEIKEIRGYNGNFQDLYVIPHDINLPSIYDPDGENYWGKRVRSFLAESKIVGGTSAKSGEFPWQASIRDNTANPWWPLKHRCGAVVISSCWVLTAAHCFNRIIDESSKKYYIREHHVRVGDIFNGENNTFSDEKEEWEQDLQIEDIYIHPNFERGSSPISDIALIKLAKLVGNECIHYNHLTQPINLPMLSLPDLQRGKECVITGWGATNGDTSMLDPNGIDLQKANVRVKSLTRCRENYGLRPNGEDKILDGMLCAASNKKDACKGDSGGPLYCSLPTDKKTFVLRGITSWGEGCAISSKPGVYTDVKYFMDWITNVTNATHYRTAPRHSFSFFDKLPRAHE